MLQYKQKLTALLKIKSEPNNHEVHLFERGQKYIQKLEKIPGIEMIAIVNSLSMYATHPDSDIDLFIVTKPGMIWFVRFFCTLILWKHGVWRRGRDIAGNLCLSFFITTEAMDLSRLAIENDIYLYYWIYYMKPILVKNDTSNKFLETNNWVEIDENQKIENQIYMISNGGKSVNSLKHSLSSSLCKFCISVDEIFVKIASDLNFAILENKSNTDIKMKHRRFKRFLLLFIEKVRGMYLKNGDILIRGIGKGSLRDDKKIHGNAFGTFSTKSTKNGVGLNQFYNKLNQIIRYFLLPQTLKSYKKLGNPEGIIVSDSILKFHDRDKRKEIRDTILENNFDK